MAVINAGQITHASDLVALQGLSSRLDSDATPVNNATALANSALVIALAANTVYALDTFIAYDTSAAADLSWGLACPAGSTGSASLWGSGTAAASTSDPIFHDVFTWSGSLTGGVLGGVASGTIMSARIVGTIRTAATAGNLTFQYAQVTATVVNTFLKKDSWIFARKL